MNKINFEISSEQSEKIRNMLSNEGLSQSEIDKILLGDYSEISNTSELENVFGKEGNFIRVLEMLRDGYTHEDIQLKYPKQFEQFQSKLDEMNLSIGEAKAINQYTEGSDMINSYKRGLATKQEIKDGFIEKLTESLVNYGLKEENIPQIEKYISNFDYEQPLYKIFEKARADLNKANYPSSMEASICTGIRDFSKLHNIDSTIEQLDSAMQKSKIPESTKVYRAISSKDGIFRSENAYSSTSPLQAASFDKYKDMDVLMELYVPKGTRGLDISSFSDYGDVEQEVLLGSNDMYFTNIQRNVIGEDGKSKTIIKGLVLSKDRECYKGIDKEIEKPQKQQEEPILDNSSYEQTIQQSNLPVRQGRFSRFFNRVRARFQKGYRQNDQTEIDTQSQDNYKITQKSKPKEKKSWELEPEEKARIQKSTAEIARQYREQQENTIQQNPTLSMEQNQQINSQMPNQGQVPIQPQQPMMDIGGMEL